jgi:hypothetical protein
MHQNNYFIFEISFQIIYKREIGHCFIGYSSHDCENPRSLQDFHGFYQTNCLCDYGDVAGTIAVSFPFPLR